MIAKDAKFLHKDSEDSDNSERMIRVFVGRICQKVCFLKLWLNMFTPDLDCVLELQKNSSLPYGTT